MIFSYHKGGIKNVKGYKKTISLPYELFLEVEKIAKEEGKTLSAVVQEALRILYRKKLEMEFLELQDFRGYLQRKI